MKRKSTHVLTLCLVTVTQFSVIARAEHALVVNEREATLCLDWKGIVARWNAALQNRTSDAFPPGPPQCVDLPEGVKLLGLEASHEIVGVRYVLVSYAGDQYWVREEEVSTKK